MADEEINMDLQRFREIYGSGGIVEQVSAGVAIREHELTYAAVGVD